MHALVCQPGIMRTPATQTPGQDSQPLGWGAPKSKGPSPGHHPAWGDKQAHCRSIDLGIASQLAGALPAS